MAETTKTPRRRRSPRSEGAYAPGETLSYSKTNKAGTVQYITEAHVGQDFKPFAETPRGKVLTTAWGLKGADKAEYQRLLKSDKAGARRYLAQKAGVTPLR